MFNKVNCCLNRLKLLDEEQKREVVFVLIFCTSFFANAQKISGNYKQVDPQIAAKDIGVTYKFEEGSFKRIEHIHLNKNSVTGGAYTVSGDTLTLFFKPLDDRSKSHVKIIKDEKLSTEEVLETEIFVEDGKGKELRAVILELQSGDKSPVIAYMSDNKGTFPKLNLYDPYIKYLRISYLTGNEIVVSTDSLFGYRTKLKIQITDSNIEYESKTGVEKYIIERLNSEELRVFPLSGSNSAMLLFRVK